MVGGAANTRYSPLAIRKQTTTKPETDTIGEWDFIQFG